MRFATAGFVAGVGVLVFTVGWAKTATAQEPSLAEQVFFGGAGSQRGTAVAVEGTSVYVVGWNQAAGLEGVLLRYGVPPGAPVWSTTLGGANFNGVTTTPTAVFAVGGAAPGTCSGSGGTANRSLLGVFAPTGSFLNCHSADFFPFDGQESYAAAAAAGFVFAGGRAEQKGDSQPLVLVKYDAAGVPLNQVTEPGIVLGSFGCCIGESGVEAIDIVNADVYVAGFSRLVGAQFGEDNFVRPLLMRYDFDLQRIWKARPGDVEGVFRGVAGLGGYVYAAGTAMAPGGDTEYLVEKYDDMGNRVWSVTSGGAGNDVLTGLVVLGDRLFASGYTYSNGAGGADAVLLEIDLDSGATLSTTGFGGAQDDFANGLATDGTDLFVAAESRSFASAAGNVVGDNDLVLLRYTFNGLPVANAGRDQTVAAHGCVFSQHGCRARVKLDGRGSSDPDGDTLTYTWTGPFGTRSGKTPQVVLPLGAHTITLTVNDGHGGTDTDTVEVRVVDVKPPRILGIRANPRVLWPANHQMVPVTVSVLARDACDSTPSCRVVSVTSNEPVSGTGSGDLSPDWVLQGGLHLLLRAERRASGPGRVYTITVACTDDAGNGTTRVVKVKVPKNLSDCDDDDDDDHDDHHDHHDDDDD